MRILHLSDLHYGKKYRAKIERMLPQLISKLDELHKTREIDLILFTGDLVWTGSDSNFTVVQDEIINKILDELHLNRKQFVFCAGNHDLKNEEEMPAIKDYIDNMDSNDALDAFVEKDGLQFDLSCQRTESFLKFVSEYNNDNYQKLYQKYSHTIEDRKITVIAFNTAWRSFIGNHSGQLLIPKKIIEQALRDVSKKEILISMMHHPIEDLKLFNRYEVEDLIFEKFHMNFSGHYHKKKQNVVLTHDIGLLNLSAMATMSGNDSSTIGFSLVDLNLDTYDIDINNFTYASSDNIFTKTSNTQCALPMNEKKERTDKAFKKIKENYEETLDDSNSLLVNNLTEENDFLDFFNKPILKEKSYFECVEKKIRGKRVEFDELFDKNSLIFGKDKYGKTSLLRKLQLDILSNYQRIRTIPIYIDLKHEKGLIDFSFVSKIKTTLKITRRESEDIFKNFKLHFLVDNFDIDNLIQKEFICKIKSINETVRVTVVSEEMSESIQFKGFLDFQKMFIHPVSRKNIRTHVCKMLIDSDEERQEEVISKINTIFNQMNIPYNYWHLSMFLWIYKKEKNIVINDNIEMLILYVEKLLERENLSKYNTSIDFDLFLKLLGELAFSFFKYHEANCYSMTYAEVINFIVSFKERNIRFIPDEKDIIEYLLEKGLLKRSRISSRINFRLNGLMEYFLSIYMLDHKDFVDEVISSEELFLSFANEIEIYAGLDRKNETLLNDLYKKVTGVLIEINTKYNESPDIELRKRLSDAHEIAKTIKKINIQDQLTVPLEEQDELQDDIGPTQGFNEEVQVKEVTLHEEGFTPTQIERHIFILARAFRGLYLVDNTELINDVFDFIVASYINFGFEMIYELNIPDQGNEKEIESKIKNLLSCFIPLITQLLVSEAVLHKNLYRFIKSKIEKLEEKSDNNQYNLIILYFMLLDTNLSECDEIVKKIVDKISLISLQNISVLKLLYILIFKTNGNKKISDFLKSKIVEIQMKIDPDSDKNKLLNSIDKEILKEHITIA